VFFSGRLINIPLSAILNSFRNNSQRSCARSNITEKEEKALKALAAAYFSYDEAQINQAIKLGELIEVKS
jgi:hypothetical protein